MTHEMIFTNARLVLADAVLDGTLVVRNGMIAEVQRGRSHVAGAEDMHGDVLMPGMVDVHTDNLERQVLPRANARWPSRSALLAHDAQCVAAGVTTVLDALCLGDLGFDPGRGQTFRDGVRDLDEMRAACGLKAEHYLHLRCELPAPDLLPALDSVADHAQVVMVSLMDHSPGVGQYRDQERYREMRMRQKGLSVQDVESRIEELLAQRERLREPQRRVVLDRFSARGIPLASHDDDNAADVARNAADGIMISEFPVAMEAAAATRAHGVTVIGGAPNIVRGGSHSGNLAVADLVQAGLLDAFASDYVPSAMIEAAWRAAELPGCSLPQAVAMVSDAPARMAKLSDRGRLAVGLRADVVRVQTLAGLPVLRGVWSRGVRVA